MSEKPKRPWFHFHLLTAVLMVLAAGVWIGINCRAAHVSTQQNSIQVENWDYRGWPMTWSADVYYTVEGRVVMERTLVIPVSSYVIDGAMGFGICLSVAFLSESVLRRREGRKV